MKQHEAPVRIGAVLRSTIFWLVAIPVMLGAFGMNAAIAHLSALLTDDSITASGAVLALSMLGVSGIVGRLITGYLLDRLFASNASTKALLAPFGLRKAETITQVSRTKRTWSA